MCTTKKKKIQYRFFKLVNYCSIKWLTFIALLTNISIVFNLQAQPQQTRSGNPIIQGWYADPEVAYFDQQFWIYPTYSDVYEKQVFMDAFSSTDLIHWTAHKNILDTAQVKWAKRAMWAPAIIKKDDNYFLFFSANDIQHDNETGGIGIAISKNPAGPFTDYLGKPLIDKFHNGAQPIDQFIFKDTDGSCYMFYGGWRHCNIVRLSNDFKSLVPFADGKLFREITPTGYVEGPFMFIRNNKYYFMWSEGDWGGADYSVAYAIADSPLGPFKRIGKILQQDLKVATGAGHHSVLQIPGKDEWYIVYHRRPLTETHPNHRVTCIDKMEFTEDGLIKSVVITRHGVDAVSLK